MANPGIVHGVLEGIKETTWGGVELSFQVEGSDRKGRAITSYVDARMGKDQVENGLHNAYRPYLGKQVYAPAIFGNYQKEKGAQAYDQVEISGAPLNIQAVTPVREAPAPRQQAAG